MNRKIISRILAILGLICAVGMAVSMTVYFFNMGNKEISGTLGTLSVIFVCATLVFFIPAYALNKRGSTTVVDENGMPVEGDDENESDGALQADVSVFAGSETENGEQHVDADDDVVPDGKDERNKKGEKRQN